jgi:hypothetical protein
MQKRLTRGRPAAAWQRRRAEAVLAVIALALSGCMSLKENKVTQTTPGKVTIRTVVCASNYARTAPLPECGPTNLFAADNNRADAKTAKKGQLLVGFRVPIGADGPGSFSTKSPVVGFTRSETYAGELRRLFPPPADQQWIGYISAVGDYDPAGFRVLEMEPEFTLPASAAGSPFRWRSVVGFREGADAAAPVSCPQPDPSVPNGCIESPAENRIRTDEANAVSDFGLVGGATIAVFPGTTAVVPFKLRYLDGAHLGRQSFALLARTVLPRTSARSAPQTLANPDATTEVNTQVPVPTNTPAGRYAVTLTSAIGSPAVTRAATGTIVVQPLPQRGNAPAPLPAAGKIDFTFRKVRAGGRKVTRMVATEVPAKGTVAVRCRGRGCVFTSKTIKGRRTVSLARHFRGRTLRPITLVTVRIAGPNRIAKEISFTIRKGLKTVARKRCRPPGAKKTLPCAA